MSYVSLVSVLYNCPDVLSDFFGGLSRQKFKDYHLFLIDNSSDDESYLESLRLINLFSLDQNVTLIKNDTNVGISCANNQGILRSLAENSKYTLLLNNDITWESDDTLELMVSYSDINNTDMLVPKILFHDNRHIWCAGGGFTNYKGVTYHRGEGEIDSGQYDFIAETDYAPTCFMLINNDVFKHVGIMDEQFFVYYDDTDFIWRARKLGKQLTYFYKAVICHKVSSSTGGNLSPFSIYQSTKNRIIFIRKNYSITSKIIAISFLLSTRVLLLDIVLVSSLRKQLLKGIMDGFTVHLKNKG